MKIIVNEAHFEVKLLPRNDNNEIWAPQLRFDVYDISIQSTNGNWEVRIDSFVSFSSLAEFSLFLILSTLFSPLISSPSSFIPLNPPSFISPLLSSILSFNSSLFLSCPSFIPLPSSFPPFSLFSVPPFALSLLSLSLIVSSLFPSSLILLGPSALLHYPFFILPSSVIPRGGGTPIAIPVSPFPPSLFAISLRGLFFLLFFFIDFANQIFLICFYALCHYYWSYI